MFNVRECVAGCKKQIEEATPAFGLKLYLGSPTTRSGRKGGGNFIPITWRNPRSFPVEDMAASVPSNRHAVQHFSGRVLDPPAKRLCGMFNND